MKSTTRFSKNKRGIECLNCKQPISDKDNFCSNCGQVNDELPLSIKQFISEFFSGFFSFDTRFFKTLVPLIFKPGKVSKDYVEGKRGRYVNPFRLYLNVTIVFFLLQGLLMTIDEYRITGSISQKTTIEENDTTEIKANEELKIPSENVLSNNSQTKPENITNNDSIGHQSKDSIVTTYEKYIEENHKDSLLRINIKRTKNHIDSLFKATRYLDLFKSDTLSIAQKDSLFDKYFELNMNFIEFLTNSNKVENWNQINNLSLLKEFTINYTDEAFKSKNITYDIPDKAKISVEDELILNIVGKSFFKKISNFITYDNENKNATTIEALEYLNLENTSWNAFYFRMAKNINKLKDDPEFRKSYIKNIISKTSIALFFLLPIFTLFLLLLYIRHKWNYTEHLVFVFNVQTVFFLLLIFFIIFDRILTTDLGIILFIPLFLFYLERALRNFYGQGWFKTIVKFMLLNFFYLVLSFAGLIVVLFIAFIL